MRNEWQVIFADRKSAEEAPARTDWAVISITEPLQAAALQAGWHAILRLEFHDVEDWEHQDVENVIHFTDEDAEKIIQFVEDLPDDLKGILVHCRAGISRSAAVAKWISEAHGLLFPQRYDAYNYSVFSRLRKIAKERMGNE